MYIQQNFVADEEIIQRASRAYMRRFGAWAPYPSQSGSVLDDGVVTLHNCNGVLARYAYDATRNRLRWLAANDHQ